MLKLSARLSLLLLLNLTFLSLTLALHPPRPHITAAPLLLKRQAKSPEELASLLGVNTSSGVPLPILLGDPDAKDADVASKAYDVQYWGIGAAGSTVYQVLTTDVNGVTHTARLIADATGAKLVQAQITTLVNGENQAVGAGVSCGFGDGLGGDKAGYCLFYGVVAGTTTTWKTAVTNIGAATTITPTPSAIESSIAATATGYRGKDMGKGGPGGSSSSSSASSSGSSITMALAVLVSALLGAILVL